MWTARLSIAISLSVLISIARSAMYGFETNPWVGTDSKGNLLADGVYFYIVDLYNDATGEADKQNGTITIISN